jgi:hypothetical protein
MTIWRAFAAELVLPFDRPSLLELVVVTSVSLVLVMVLSGVLALVAVLIAIADGVAAQTGDSTSVNPDTILCSGAMIILGTLTVETTNLIVWFIGATRATDPKHK